VVSTVAVQAVDTTVIAVVMAVVNITDINQPRCYIIPILSEYRDFFCLNILLNDMSLNESESYNHLK